MEFLEALAEGGLDATLPCFEDLENLETLAVGLPDPSVIERAPLWRFHPKHASPVRKMAKATVFEVSARTWR
jgi:hypothetical protein